MMKRLCAGILSVALASAICACGSEKKEGGEITRLKMILPGDKPAIYDEIYGKLNEMLREDIGAELEVEYYNYSDLNQKYSLLFSSGEECDIVFAADWLQYNQQASKNSFMEITDDMLKEYAPKTYETLTEIIKNEASVNGKLYMIPNTAKEYSENVVLIRGDLREKYGLGKLNDINDFEKYLTMIAEKESDIIPVVDLALSGLWTRDAVIAIPPSTELAYDIEKDEFVKKDYQDWYINSVKKTRELVDKGVIPADISVNKTTGSMFENGKAATYVKNLETSSSMAKKLRASHPEWKIEMYSFKKDVPKVINSSISNGLSLNRICKNPEKALQTIELLRNDKRYFDLTWYGIEGKHWQAEGDRGYISLNDSLPAEEKYVAGAVWGWKNESMLRRDSSEIPEKQEILDAWEQVTVDSDIYGFTFDDTNVKTEIATVKSTASQYGGPLYNGMVAAGEIDKAFSEYQKKLEQAGIDKIYDEVTRQYKEYREKKDAGK
ncbi:MAG: ABC transporter substrate-binding protein [Clostridia bacterium]|nr:ABC transporter substrate-binding protein [Clostridia bacterium]